jgi:membrane dipeptidase
VSRAAVDLVVASDFVDLHLDLEVPVRVIGWDPCIRHPENRRPPLFWGHTDLPRLQSAGFTGVVHDIATNPFRFPSDRLATTLRNVERVKRRATETVGMAFVRDYAEYLAAKAAGLLSTWISLQGGNALEADVTQLQGSLGQDLHRITVVHLTTSRLGGTSSPAGRDDGLLPLGVELVERCHAARVLVDLAHAGKKTFQGILQAHTRDLPPIVSHTGVDGVRPHWRNLDDGQIRQIADRGGVIGIMYQSQFLQPVWLYARRSAIVDHLEHVIQIGGEDAAAIGTDYDGAIVPPLDLPDVTHHARLVQDMLDRGWSETRIQKILGQNYLRVVQAIRPGAAPLSC